MATVLSQINDSRIILTLDTENDILKWYIQGGKGVEPTSNWKEIMWTFNISSPPTYAWLNPFPT